MLQSDTKKSMKTQHTTGEARRLYHSQRQLRRAMKRRPGGEYIVSVGAVERG